jgi:hypothetical protein
MHVTQSIIFKSRVFKLCVLYNEGFPAGWKRRLLHNEVLHQGKESVERAVRGEEGEKVRRRGKERRGEREEWKEKR